MSAREQAIQDIKDDLRQSHTFFIQFRKELNPVMRALVKEQLKAQKQKKQ